MQTHRKTRHPGIVVRHQGKCSLVRGGERCTCKPSYQASVYFAREGRRLKRHHRTLAAAKTWREDMYGAIRRGEVKPPERTTLSEAAEAWLEGAKAGTVRSRSRRPFKPSTVRGYERSLRGRVLPALGHLRLADVTRHDVQALADRMLGDGLSPSAMRNQLDPLRSIFRRAVTRGEVVINPTADLDLEAARSSRPARIVSPGEARTLLEALPAEDRPLWATAFYAGLRRGELLALRVSDVDLARSEIRVERSWDQEAGATDPKSDAGSRTVPLLAILRDHLDEHLLRCDRSGGELIFGRTPERPPVPSTLRSRALRAWKAAGLEPIGLHDARHTFASTLIDAGISNAKAIQEVMGHASIQMTFDTYGHLLPGKREEVRDRADTFLEEALAA